MDKMPPSQRWLLRWAEATGLAGCIPLLLCTVGSCSLLFESQPAADAAPITPDAAVASDAEVPTCPAHTPCGVNWISGPCGCYQFRSAVPVSWQNSTILCSANEGYPVEVETEAENLWLASVMADQFWLGLKGSLEGETWQWTREESPLMPEDYNGFLSGILPNISADVCANSMGGVWEAVSCEQLRPVICEQNF